MGASLSLRRDRSVTDMVAPTPSTTPRSGPGSLRLHRLSRPADLWLDLSTPNGCRCAVVQARPIQRTHRKSPARTVALPLGMPHPPLGRGANARPQFFTMAPRQNFRLHR
jgi:hypothetical protein